MVALLCFDRTTGRWAVEIDDEIVSALAAVCHPNAIVMRLGYDAIWLNDVTTG